MGGFKYELQHGLDLRSGHTLTTIEVKRHAGDEGCISAGKERHRCGDVFHLRIAAQGNLLQDAFAFLNAAALSPQPTGALGHHHPGADAVDGNALGAEFLSQLARQSADRALSCGVVRTSDQAAKAPSLGAEVDDPAVLSGGHRWEYGAASSHCTHHVKIHHALPMRFILVKKSVRRVQGAARIVDKDVDPTRSLENCRYAAVDIDGVGRIHAQGVQLQTDRFGSLRGVGKCLFVEVGDPDMGTFSRESHGGGKSNATSGRSDQRRAPDEASAFPRGLCLPYGGWQQANVKVVAHGKVLFCGDVGELDDLAPAFGLAAQAFAEVAD